MPPVTELLLLLRPGALAILPPALAALFWLWLAAAVVIYVVRIIRRVNRRGTTPDSDLDTPASPAAAAPPAAPAPAGGPLVTPVPATSEPAPTGGVEEHRTGFFAPSAETGAAGSGAGGRRPDTPRATVVEATRGIAMPCNLSPVVDGTVSIPNPFRVAFLTTDADAVTVGAALGDELERLGFTLTTPAATELLARKPGVELRVVLYPTASAARRGLDLIFPAAPDHAVGVEFTT